MLTSAISGCLRFRAIAANVAPTALGKIVNPIESSATLGNPPTCGLTLRLDLSQPARIQLTERGRSTSRSDPTLKVRCGTIEVGKRCGCATSRLQCLSGCSQRCLARVQGLVRQVEPVALSENNLARCALGDNCSRNRRKTLSTLANL
jgi:hypothetical protein